MDAAHASRPEGYYWVVRSGRREIAHWDAGAWWRFADESGYSDASFEEIDERRIISDGREIECGNYSAGRPSPPPPPPPSKG